jgi:opacity protein-like surface antigen
MLIHAEGAMMFRRLARAGSALALGLAVSGGAAAQNYDGGVVARFGAFAQPILADFSQTQPTTGSDTASGVQGGFSAGLDFRSSPYWLWGLEADWAFGDARTTIAGVNYGVDFQANLRGRFGVWARPDILLYGTAGVSFLGIEVGNPALATSKAAETLTGLTVGVGFEYLWHHVSLFGEYNYATYGSEPVVIGGTRHEADAEVHAVRVGLKFNVGHDHAHGIGEVYRPMK